jgi:hypothetical protein
MKKQVQFDMLAAARCRKIIVETGQNEPVTKIRTSFAGDREISPRGQDVVVVGVEGPVPGRREMVGHRAGVHDSARRRPRRGERPEDIQTRMQAGGGRRQLGHQIQ